MRRSHSLLGSAAVRVVLISIWLGLAGLLAGCGDDGEVDERLVVAGHFPLAWVAEELVSDGIEVVDLTPSGGEPHDLELTADQIDAVHDAATVVVLGGGFQPALEEVADGAVVVLDQLGESGDPHVWLDPVLMAEIVDVVAVALDREAEAAPVREQVEALDERFREGLADCERDLVVTAHDAFSRLAARYDLRAESLAGIEPDQEPDPARLAELADLVRAEGVSTVFTEELVSPDVALALAREAGVATATLDTIEGGGGDYVERMDANLAALREALGCR